jgi:hypothetical protein
VFLVGVFFLVGCWCFLLPTATPSSPTPSTGLSQKRFAVMPAGTLSTIASSP